MNLDTYIIEEALTYPAHLYNFFSVLTIFLFFLHSPCSANAKVDEKRLNHLSLHPQWIAFLYYEENIDEERQRFSSSVDNPNFFLSPKGRFSPYEELNSLITNLNDENLLMSTYCQFPARSKWASDELVLNITPPQCPEYDRWKSELLNEEVSIVFATPYLDDPASFVGHTFLKFSNPSTSGSELTTGTLNYSAQIPPGINSVSYLTKGINGGFWGVIKSEKMFVSYRRYAHDEQRDLWEYKLNFTRKELAVLIAHAWEIKGKTFKYHYFNENCSYRLIGLLRAASPHTIHTTDFERLAIPIETLKYVSRRGLVKSTKHWKSPLRLILEDIDHMDRKTIDTIKKLAFQKNPVKLPIWLLKKPTAKQNEVLVVLHRYIGYLIESNKISAQLGGNKIFEIIQLLSENKLEQSLVAKPYNDKFSEYDNPLNSHSPSRITVYSGYTPKENGVAMLGFRLIGHDSRDHQSGYIRGNEISFLEGELYFNSHSQRLKKITLLKSRSEPISTNLIPRPSWEFEINVENISINDRENQSTITPQIIGFRGITIGKPDHYASVKFGGKILHYTPEKKPTKIFAGIKLSTVYSSSGLNYSIDFEYLQDPYNPKISTQKYTASITKSISINQSIYASLAKSNQEYSVLGIGYQRYF